MKLAALGLLLVTSTCSHDSQLWSEYVTNRGQPGLLNQVLQDYIEGKDLGIENILVFEDYQLIGFHAGREPAEVIESTLSISSGMETRFDQAVRDFCQKNFSETIESDLLSEEIAFPLLSAEDNVKYFYGSEDWEGKWEQLTQDFPSAKQVVYLSQVGFSEDGETAMVYLAAKMPEFSGLGETFIYRHEQGKWELIRNDLGPSWREE